MPRPKQSAVWDRALRNPYEGKPHGWVQWKGTDVCADIYCVCGHHGHVDGDFVYSVRCPECGRIYALNGHIELVEATPEEAEEMGHEPHEAT